MYAVGLKIQETHFHRPENRKYFALGFLIQFLLIASSTHLLTQL